MRKTTALAAAATAAFALAPATASADVRVDMFVFENADGVPTSGLDVWINAIDNGSTIDLVWHNDSSIPATVTDIYLEGSDFAEAALDAATIHNTAQVVYSEGSAPPNPAGSIAGFGGVWKGNVFSADPDTPQPMVKAINPGESLTITFDLGAGYSAGDVIAALQAGDFRAAAHVQGLDPNDNSIWVVTPTPGTMALLAMGGVFTARRRR